MIKNLPVILAELGKIKIGMKGSEITTRSGNKMRLPVKLDHFIITKTERGADGNFVIDDAMMKIVGKEPKELRVMLPFNSIDANFTTALKSYQGKKLFCTGNNEKAQRLQADGSRKEIVCNFDTCPIAVEKKCKATGVLSVILPQCPELGGVYKFRTTSWHGVVKTLSSLYFLQNITKNLTGVRLTMKLLSGVADVNGKSTNFKYVSLVYKGEDVTMLMESNKINELRSEQQAVSKKLELEYAKVTEAEIVKEDHDEQEEFHPTEVIEKSGMVINKSTGEVIDHVEAPDKALTGQNVAKTPENALSNQESAIPMDSEPAATQQSGLTDQQAADFPEFDRSKDKPESANSSQENVQGETPPAESQTGAIEQTNAQGANKFAQAQVVQGPQDITHPAEPSPPRAPVIEDPTAPPQQAAIAPQAKEPAAEINKKSQHAIDQRNMLIKLCDDSGMPLEIWGNYMRKQNLALPLEYGKFNNLVVTCKKLCELYQAKNLKQG